MTREPQVPEGLVFPGVLWLVLGLPFLVLWLKR